jgi:hypothetical protein
VVVKHVDAVEVRIIVSAVLAVAAYAMLVAPRPKTCCPSRYRTGPPALAAMYLRRVRVVGLSFAAALTYVSAVVTPPAPVVSNLGVGLQQPCWGGGA